MLALAAEFPDVDSPVPFILGDPPVAPKPLEFPRRFTIEALPPGGLVLDTQDREATRVFYRGVYFQSADAPIGWAGNYATGDAGTTAQLFRDAVATRLNWYRVMAGVPALISQFDQYNVKDQQAALMMSANNTLSHPDSGNAY